MIHAGDTVRTNVQLHFLEATHPETGEEIETMIPRWHRLTVIGVDRTEGTVSVSLPGGHLATIPIEDVEA